MTTRPSFIHLHTHSQYSLLEGALRMKEIPKLCQKHAMPALALTDSNNLFGALEFSEIMAQNALQPIIGLEIDCDFEGWDPKHTPLRSPMVFLAKDAQGYQNLLKLSSHYFTTTPKERTRLTLEIIEAHHAGLIALTGGSEGPIARKILEGHADMAHTWTKKLAEIFGDRLYIELQRHHIEVAGLEPSERHSEADLVRLAYDLEIPLVATNNVHFSDSAFYEANDVMLCIAQGAYVDGPKDRRRALTPAHNFKSQEEMRTIFADLPEAIENTIEIAQRTAFKVSKRKPILPSFSDDETETLRLQAHAGLDQRLASIPHADTPKAYRNRLEYELSIIEKMGFSGYFLIVADFIQWAKLQNIPVGPGRGSGAGSLVAYALGITGLDPLRFKLLFERFLNPERISMPDFDIDFCQDRREEVINYVQTKYGHDRVAQIITFGALMSKAAVRDVGRVLQMPYNQVDKLSKLIPIDGVKPLSITEARKKEPRFSDAERAEPVVKRLLDIAEKIEGLYRNASTHAAGIVISDRPLDTLVPLYQDQKSTMPATGFNMKWVEQAGLVKFDFLGLRNLTVIQDAVTLLKKRDVHLDIAHIPLDDPATYALYGAANTVGVFQVEGAGMRDTLKQMRPTSIEDIVALVALYRPGPMENIPKYCRVKNGLEAREFIHPLIDPILDETQGIIVYQEQVMEIAQKMAGYTLGGADNLRRAMGKKIKEDMDAERPKFIAGAKENGVPEKTASNVFDLLEKFANYGFNKSHAAAYALVSYQTAYLKANYPAEFMAAVMNGDLANTDKLALFKQELDAMGISLHPIDINHSFSHFDVHEGGVLYALGALKNVGTEAMDMLVQAREQDGIFQDIYDFAQRVHLRALGKRSLEALAKSGAFDPIEPSRTRVLDHLDLLIQYSNAYIELGDTAQDTLFGDIRTTIPKPRLGEGRIETATERLSAEQEAIGFYMSGHPLDRFASVLKRHNIANLYDQAARAESEAFAGRIAGTVMRRQERISAKGSRFAFIDLSDSSGNFEVMIFSDLLAAHGDLLELGKNVVMEINVARMGDSLRANVKSIMAIEALAFDPSKIIAKLSVSTPNDIEVLHRLLAHLEKLKEKRGSLRIEIPLQTAGRALFELDAVPLGAESQATLKQHPAVNNFEVF